MAQSDKVSVLFVCLGNICRSPMAEAVFAHLAKDDGRINEVDSCGTAAYHVGEQPDSRTLSELSKNGIKFKHAARKFDASDFTRFNFIMAMDKNNQRHLDQERKRLIQRGQLDEATAGEVKLWGSYAEGKPEEVIDPYYGGQDGFTVAFEQSVRFTKAFLASLEQKQ